MPQLDESDDQHGTKEAALPTLEKQEFLQEVTAEPVVVEMQEYTVRGVDMGAEVESGFYSDDSEDCDHLKEEMDKVMQQEERRLEPRVSPFSLTNLALPMHYLTAGFITAVSSGMLYGVLLGVMAVDAHIYVTSQTTVLAPWGCKCLLAFISDHFPIAGYRRKPYCILGYTISAAAFIYMIFMFDEPEPFHCLQQDNTYDSNSICNQSAAATAHVIVLLLAVVILGLVIADSAADGLMIEACHSAPTTTEQDSIPLTCWMLRTIGSAAGSVLLAFGFNGPLHLGFFRGELPLQTIFIVCFTVCFTSGLLWVALSGADVLQSSRVPCCRCYNPPGTTTWKEHIAYTRCDSAARQLAVLFKLSSSKAFFGFMIFNIVSPALTNLSSPVEPMMRRYWADVQQLQQQFTSLATSLVYILSLAIIRAYYMRKNWHTIVRVVVILSLLINLPISILTALGVYRNQYFYLIEDVLDALPSAAMFLVASLATIEMSPKGQEATLYGITTTAHALAVPIARTIANWLYGHLPEWLNAGAPGSYSEKAHYINDSPEFRASVAVSLCVAAAAAVASLCFLGLLPKNQRAAKAVLANTTRKALYGFLTWTFFSICLAAGILLNFIALLPTVRCTQWVGGSGC